MDINKAIRKQRKSYTRFIFSMGFIFLILPIVLYVFKRFELFYFIYLGVIELLILLAIVVKIYNEYIKYECNGTRLKIRFAFGRNRINLSCDKVVLVHVEENNSKTYKIDDFKIIIMSSAKSRNSVMHPVTREFLVKHPYISYCYDKLTVGHEDDKYFYYIIGRGGLIKYELLDLIYTNCVNAYFTEEAIAEIKAYKDN